MQWRVTDGFRRRYPQEVPPAMTHDVFISYSNKDELIADAVCHALEAPGMRCWIAHRDMVPGEDFAAVIVQTIAASRVMVLIFSRGANSSPHVLSEVANAIDAGVIIVPFRIDDVQMSDAMKFF